MAKFIYMDEAGTDVGAPATVVAGVVVDPDNEWDLALKFMDGFKATLPDVPDDWVLHATELFSGGKTLEREKYGKEVRYPVLEVLFQLPRFLQLPIFFAWQWKDTVNAADPKLDAWLRQQMTFMGHSRPRTTLCSRLTRGERANITPEDVPDKKQFLTAIPIMLRMAGSKEEIDSFDCIVDTPNFASKQGAPHLALADALAFAVRLYLSGHRDGPWAMKHVFNCDDVTGLFAESRKAAGGAYALDWRWLELGRPRT